MQRIQVLEKCADILFRVLPNSDAGGRRILDDAVVHVGQVHHLQDAVAARVQKSPQNVLKHEGSEISDVREVIYRRPAGVHAHFALMNGLEGLQAICQRVVQVYLFHFRAVCKSVILSEASLRSQPSNRRVNLG